MNHETIDLAVKAAGSVNELARICDVPAPSIYTWRFVPQWHMRRISEVTGLPLEALVPASGVTNPKARRSRIPASIAPPA